MSELAAVIKILDDNAKHGTSAKTGKPWSMSRVELNNGEGVFIFNPIEIGDAVEKVQNGEFFNWQKHRTDPKHDEIMKALNEIIKLLTNDTKVEQVAGDDMWPEPPEDVDNA